MARQTAGGVSLSLLGALLLTTGMQAPAGAAPVTTLDSICYVDEVCMFEDEDYYGDKYVFSAVNEGPREIGGWNGDNEISSVKNRSRYALCLYEDDKQGGDWVRLAPGEYVSSLEDSHDFDNDAESFRLTSGNC